MLSGAVSRSQWKQHRKREGCCYSSLPVTQPKAPKTTYFMTRSLCSTVAGQAAIWQGEFKSAALTEPSAIPESRAGSSNLSCKSHFRHTKEKEISSGGWKWLC